MGTQLGNQTEKREMVVRPFNPFRNTTRDALAHHMMSAGSGAIDPLTTQKGKKDGEVIVTRSGTITKQVTLNNGAVYEITVQQIEPAKNKADPFGFTRERKARKKKS